MLISHESSQADRGRFLYRFFDKGMIESISQMQWKLNMNYITKLYPNESSRINKELEKNERWMIAVRDNLDFKIENEEQFQRGKELLQRMNKALLDYSGN